jgi:hypothetical protein
MSNVDDGLSPNSGEGVGGRCEFKIYQERTLKDGSKHVVVVDSFDGGLQSFDEADKAYALVVTQHFNKKQQLEKTKAMIRSPFLRKVFREVGKSHPMVASDFVKPFELESPFQVLFHHWEDLEEHAKSTEDDDVRMHLNLLFEFMKIELGPARDKVLDMMESKQINYNLAWTIFKPGAVLLTTELGHPWLLVCERTAYEVSTSIGPYMEVHCRYTDFDGTRTGNAPFIVMILQKKTFGGNNPASILELPIYPRRFDKRSKDELEVTLRKRGEKFLGLRGLKTVYYDGLARWFKEPPNYYYDDRLLMSSGLWLTCSVR